MKHYYLILTALLANMVCGLAQESAQSDDTKKYAQPVEHPSVYSPQVEAMIGIWKINPLIMNIS